MTAKINQDFGTLSYCALDHAPSNTECRAEFDAIRKEWFDQEIESDEDIIAIQQACVRIRIAEATFKTGT